MAQLNKFAITLISFLRSVFLSSSYFLYCCCWFQMFNTPSAVSLLPASSTKFASLYHLISAFPCTSARIRMDRFPSFMFFVLASNVCVCSLYSISVFLNSSSFSFRNETNEKPLNFNIFNWKTALHERSSNKWNKDDSKTLGVNVRNSKQTLDEHKTNMLSVCANVCVYERAQRNRKQKHDQQ